MSSQSQTQQEIASELENAAKLEAELKSLVVTNAKTESKAAELRIKLCESFSDVLLSDCTAALRKDVTGRLWYSCFYNRIGELRKRIAKEKSRVKKAKQAGAAHDDLLVRVKNAEESLKTFIKEGITLYNFLIDRLQGSLLPCNNSQIQSQNSEASQPYSKGVIPALHKLYIHLGDMHRYGSEFTEAEKAYLQASKLAPGKGNPYNQMAVVAQMKETNGHPLPAMALYWYCRSLASKEVFETSKSNAERLFAANEKWLAKNGHEFDSDSPSLKDKLFDSFKEQAKTIKSTASRMVLSRFVLYHGKLFQNDTDDLQEELLLERFCEILDINPFGDGLIVKLVTINVFSIWNSVVEKYRNASKIAYIYLLRFACHICSSLEIILEKTESKLEDGKKATNIRLFGPLLLAFEFISNDMTSSDNSCFKEHEDDKELHRVLFEFWSSIAKIASNFFDESLLSTIIDMETLKDDASSLPDEFQSLSLGCKPFSFLDKCKSDKKSAYIDQAAAVEALGIEVSNTQSQVTPKKKSNGTEKSQEKSILETRVKLARFMMLLTNHIKAGNLIHSEDGQIVAAPMVEDETEADENMGTDIAEFSNEGLTEANGISPIGSQSNPDKLVENASSQSTSDVLVYKQSAEGKPALLVPTALLGEENLNKDEETGADIDDGSDLLKLSSIIDNNMKKKQKQSPSIEEEMKFQNSPMVPPPQSLSFNTPSPPVGPPPGFQSSNPPSQHYQSTVPQAAFGNSIPPQAQLSPMFSQLGNMPTTQQTNINAVPPPGFNQMNSNSFNLPQTRNPFASRLHSSYGVNQASNNFLRQTSFGSNEESYLNDLTLNDNEDPFGLRALGIFSDDNNAKGNLGENTLNPNQVTRNPFHLG